MKTYKVWVHIEEVDEKAGTYEEVGLPRSIGIFDNQEEAQNLVDYLVEIQQ